MLNNKIYKYEDVLSRKDFENFRHTIDIDKVEFHEWSLEKISQYPIYKICKDLAYSLFGGKSFHSTATYKKHPNDDSIVWHDDGMDKDGVYYVTCLLYLYCPKVGGETEFEIGDVIKPKENQLIVFDGRLKHKVRDTKELRQTYSLRFHK